MRFSSFKYKVKGTQPYPPPKTLSQKSKSSKDLEKVEKYRTGNRSFDIESFYGLRTPITIVPRPKR